MAVGTFTNVTSPGVEITLDALGWTIDPAETLAFDNDDDTSSMVLIRQCEELTTAGDLEVRRADTSLVSAAEMQGFFLNESIVGDELQPQAVRKTRLDISTVGESVITQLVGVDGLEIDSQTGADPGTGVVTLKAQTGAGSIITLQNVDTVTILKGQPVYVFGTGVVKLARANGSPQYRVMGLAREDIAPTASGEIQHHGILEALTTEWDAVTGQSGGLSPTLPYFLDKNTAGRMTTTAPIAQGNYVMPIGYAITPTQFDIYRQHPVKL